MNKMTSIASVLFCPLLLMLILSNNPLYGAEKDSAPASRSSRMAQTDREITITITLTNGTTRTGILVAQTQNTITIKTETGTEVIHKKYIVKTDPPLRGLEIKTRRTTRRRVRRTTYQPKPRTDHPPYNRFSLSLSVDMVGGIQMPETIYQDGITLDYLTLDETTYITPPETFPLSLGISVGFSVNFSRNLGLALTLHYLPKRTLDLYSSYYYDLDVPGVDSFSDDAGWDSSGEISLMPITINLVYSFDIGNKAKINFFAGPAIIFANIDLFANMGYGVVFIEEYDTYDLIIPEWFDIPLYISATETLFGGNAGLDIEYRVNNRIALVVGVLYFFAEERDYLWDIDLAATPIGEVNGFSMDVLDDYMGYLNELEVFNTIQFSFFKAFFGIKFYL